MNHVPHRSTGRRSHDPHTGGNFGNRLFVLYVEKPLAFEATPQLLEGELQCAEADRFHAFDHELEIAPGFVDTNVGTDDHFDAFFKFEANALGRAAKERRTNLAAIVLQGEVAVPRRRTVKIAHFALDKDPADTVLQQTIDAGEQLSHRIDPTRTACFLRCGHARGLACEEF